MNYEVKDMAARIFGTMDMAFVYGVVSLALETLDVDDSNPNDQGQFVQVSSLLGQAGFDVFMVDGRKKGEPHEWLEVGHIGETPVLIVDLSAPKNPRDTVLLKHSAKGRAYLALEHAP